MSQHSYTRTLTNGAWDAEVSSLSRDVEAAIPGEPFTVAVNGVDIEFDFTSALTAGQVTTLDSTVSTHKAGFPDLQGHKDRKIAEIDQRTTELIGQGFVYAAKNFSLSLPSQSKMVGTHQIKDNPALTYPLKWNTKNDDDKYDITDATDLGNFYLTGFGTIRAHLDSGTALKDSVRAATTVEEVAAVVDSR